MTSKMEEEQEYTKLEKGGNTTKSNHKTNTVVSTPNYLLFLLFPKMSASVHR